MKKFLTCLFVCLSVLATADLKAGELVVNEAGTSRYEAIKNVIVQEGPGDGSSVVDHLLSKDFSRRDIAIAAGYFLCEVQQDLSDDNKAKVYYLGGFEDKDKVFIESIMQNLFFIECAKRLSEYLGLIDMTVFDPEGRKEFPDKVEKFNQSLTEMKKTYMKNEFVTDWLGYSVLALGEDFEKTLGFKPESLEGGKLPVWPKTP